MERPRKEDTRWLGIADAQTETGTEDDSQGRTPDIGRLSMLDKLDFMVRFWRLRARHKTIEKPLSASERLELLSLLQLMATEHLPPPGPPPRNEQALPVQLTASGGFLAGELRMVCPEGIVLGVSTPMQPGQSTVVRMVDAIAGVEYALPCVVVWSFAGPPSAVALRIDGTPIRTTFAMPELSVWRPAPSVSHQGS